MPNETEVTFSPGRLTAIARAKNVVDGEAKDLAAFKAKIAEQVSIVYTLTWDAERAMLTEFIWRDAFNVHNFLNMIDKSDDDIRERLAHLVSSYTERLVGSMFGGIEGPWCANSTSPMSNLAKVQEANAMRMTIRLATHLLDDMKGGDA